MAQRHIAATYFMTLDGVVQDPQNWSFPYWNEETQKFKEAELEKTDALLLGRVTYEAFAAAWPSRKGMDWFATKFNTMPKYVVSKTLEKADWENTTIVRGDLGPEIRKLVAGGQGDLGVHGSVRLTRWLMQRDMLDELRILVYPLTLGQGLRLFEGQPKTKFQLVESNRFKTGVVSLVYTRTEQEWPQLPPPVQYAGSVKRTRETARK
jgi:dihydrofolate reductase